MVRKDVSFVDGTTFKKGQIQPFSYYLFRLGTVLLKLPDCDGDRLLPDCDCDSDVIPELEIESQNVFFLVVVQGKMNLVLELDTFLAQNSRCISAQPVGLKTINYVIDKISNFC